MKISIARGLLAAAGITAIAGTALATHSWGNYHWARTSNPVALKIERQITPKWEGAFATAVSDWDQSQVLALTPGTANLGVSSKRCSAVKGKILVCNDHYGQRGWLGIATIWADAGSHITQATTKLNDSYFDSPTYNTGPWIALVTCQEIGHDFGLDHQDENFNNANLGTCMDYTSDPSTNQHPNKHDYDQLETIYQHLDTYSTAGAFAATNFGLRIPGQAPPKASTDNDPGDSAAEWGRSIHADGFGRPNIFIKKLANGETKITHVFWAPK